MVTLVARADHNQMGGAFQGEGDILGGIWWHRIHLWLWEPHWTQTFMMYPNDVEVFFQAHRQITGWLLSYQLVFLTGGSGARSVLHTWLLGSIPAPRRTDRQETFQLLWILSYPNLEKLNFSKPVTTFRFSVTSLPLILLAHLVLVSCWPLRCWYQFRTRSRCPGSQRNYAHKASVSWWVLVALLASGGLGTEFDWRNDVIFYSEPGHSWVNAALQSRTFSLDYRHLSLILCDSRDDHVNHIFPQVIADENRSCRYPKRNEWRWRSCSCSLCLFFGQSLTNNI